MLIQCTKKLLVELKVEPSLVLVEKPLFSWHANVITVNRRKTVVLCNDNNRYIIVLHGLKAKDFKNMGALIIDGIRKSLLSECVKPEIIEQFIQYSPKVTFAKTRDRSMTAKLNKACNTVHFYTSNFTTESIHQIDVNLAASAYSVQMLSEDRFCPNEKMYKDLESFTGSSVICCKALQLKVTLDLENHDVWRRVIVPYNIKFPQLHHIMQIVFDWKDYHLHEFYIFDGDKPIVNLVCSEDAFEYPNDVPMLMETNVELSEYVPKYRRIKYVYDFGDNWEHYIEVEKVIDNYGMNYPICLEGIGNTPPEDVGGEGGYDEFLEAISDPDHPEHDDMINWSKMQWYKDFNINFVNIRLETSLRDLWDR